MAEYSFDIVSQVNDQELKNAIDQAQRELSNRYDFKGTQCSIELTDKQVTIVADDEQKRKQLIDLIQTKLIKRSISLNALIYDKAEDASGGTIRQLIRFIDGLESDQCKKINQGIKDLKLKVNSQTKDRSVRVSGKSKDDLQKVMSALKEKEIIPVPLQFINYR